MKLLFTLKALSDLKRLRAFIAKNNPAAAQRMSRKLTTAFNGLLDHPARGRQVANLNGVRELVKDDYVIRYLTTPSSVIILNVWHGKEDRKKYATLLIN